MLPGRFNATPTSAIVQLDAVSSGASRRCDPTAVESNLVRHGVVHAGAPAALANEDASIALVKPQQEVWRPLPTCQA